MKYVYSTHKGINAPLEFRGLRGSYIWCLGAGLAILLIVFALLYLAGAGSGLCLVVAGTGGTTLFRTVYRLNRRLGVHGLMQRRAAKGIPHVVYIRSRDIFKAGFLHPLS